MINLGFALFIGTLTICDSDLKGNRLENPLPIQPQPGLPPEIKDKFGGSVDRVTDNCEKLLKTESPSTLFLEIGFLIAPALTA